MGLVDVSFKSNLTSFNSALRKNLMMIPGKKGEAAIAKVANGLTNEVIANSPVDTGNLRSHWRTQKTGKLRWTISNNTRYIRHLEFGTYKSQKHVAFVRNSIKRYKPKAIAIIRGIMS